MEVWLNKAEYKIHSEIKVINIKVIQKYEQLGNGENEEMGYHKTNYPCVNYNYYN